MCEPHQTVLTGLLLASFETCSIPRFRLDGTGPVAMITNKLHTIKLRLRRRMARGARFLRARQQTDLKRADVPRASIRCWRTIVQVSCTKIK
jgi:hypothetical protein